MREQTFRRLLFAVTLLGVISTVALILYTVYLHQNCSIISFIANGR